MSNTLLVLDIHIEVSDHHDATFGPDTLAAPRELTRFHVALHDVDAVLLIEGDSRHLIKTHNVILANKATLTVGHIYKHSGDGSFTPGNKMSIRRHLLKQMALASSARARARSPILAVPTIRSTSF